MYTVTLPRSQTISTMTGLEVQKCLLPFACLMQLFIIVNSYKLKPLTIPEDLDNVRIFTEEELALYNGHSPNHNELYMAIRGVVFDVSSGSDFYGKGHTYNALVGLDCTRAVAKMSLDPSDLNRNIDDLNDAILQSLEKVFEGTYVSKYPVAGYMDYLLEEERQKRSRNGEL